MIYTVDSASLTINITPSFRDAVANYLAYYHYTGLTANEIKLMGDAEIKQMCRQQRLVLNLGHMSLADSADEDLFIEGFREEKHAQEMIRLIELERG